MKAKLLLLALATFLLIPALSALPISNALVCGDTEYPGCFPGGTCLDKCCYCECRLTQGPGPCSFECCLGH
jgi:hypothetical protein